VIANDFSHRTGVAGSRPGSLVAGWRSLRPRTRMRAARRRVLGLVPRPAVLMYHRIGEEVVDPWALSVSPRRFDEQLTWLKRYREVLTLSDFARRHRDGALPARATAITFDDGYACNASTAAPLLEAHDLPATIFVTTSPVSSGQEFWWDDLQRIVADAPVERLTVSSGERRMEVFLGDNRAELGRWLPGDPPSNTRQAGFLELWNALRTFEPARRDEAIDELRAQTGTPRRCRESHRPMTPEELRSLAGSGRIEIGSHTLTHPVLTEWSEADQWAEIDGGRQACARLTGATPTSFAYPFGDHGPVAVELVRRAGFEVACTTVSAPVRSHCDVLALPRLQVENWSADQLERALRFP
jgi:peptidoglycan/xylan/chitin deacetylase (PgdA/CDA1 family)